MVGVIEQMRDIHEDIENLEHAAADCLASKARRELRVNVDFCVDFIANQISHKSNELIRMYEDPDAVRSDELDHIAGDGSHDIWHAYYNRISEIKDCIGRQSNQIPTSLQSGIDVWRNSAIADAAVRMDGFTGEEHNGRYVDLTRQHQMFLNLRKYQDYLEKQFIRSQWLKSTTFRQGIGSVEESDLFKTFAANKSDSYRPMDYVTWMKQLGNFEAIPRQYKYRQEDYRIYLTELFGYLGGFIARQRPLFDLSSKLDSFKTDFETNWINRDIPGWKECTHELPFYSAPTDKLFSNERAYAGHISSKGYLKASVKVVGEEAVLVRKNSIQSDKDIAELESNIVLFRDMLSETLEDTVDHVTRKQARTSFEIERDLATMYGETIVEEQMDDDNASIASSSGGEEVDVNDRAIYNPLNLPLGWDGKPIPFWMYKLHGLGHEFTCEICGNSSYWGRRAFEIHFNEWKHVNGLKALRIPNTSHFYGITGIEEAIELNAKLRKETTSAIFNADKEMECEDALGNVMSYRAYQDLVRQGLA